MATVIIKFDIDNDDFVDIDGKIHASNVCKVARTAAYQTVECVRMVNQGTNKGVGFLRDSNGNTIGTVEVTA